MTAVLCALIVAAALCWCAWRVTSRPLSVELAHAVTVAAPIALTGHADLDVHARGQVKHTGLTDAVQRWWDVVQTPGIPQSHEPVQAEGALDEAIEAAVAHGVTVLRDAYEKNGMSYTETQLEQEAREMVVDQFGT